MTMTLAALAAASAMSAPTQVELTIYNAGFALVKEQRGMSLRSGQQQVAVEDVAELIEANSVSIRSLTDPGSFVVLEQNYQYDLISVTAILAKAVGKPIVFNRVLPNGERERVSGTLMSAPTAAVSDADGRSGTTWNGMVVRTDDGRILLNPSGEIEVGSMPDGLISKPTLLWEIDSTKAGDQQVELSYLTQGMSWKSDYVLSLDQAGKVGDFKGWVTLTNNSGASFAGAKLKLLAGEVFRQQRAPGRGGGGREDMAMKAAAADQFQEEQFADYHLYTLQRPATVRNREIKQVSLLEAMGVPVTKKLVVDPMSGYGQYYPSEGEIGTGEFKPVVQIQFRNDKASQMGMPLPMGTVKVFQRDGSGSLQMLGEASIDHTPKDELVSLPVGRAFDVVVARKRTSFEWITRPPRGYQRGTRETFEVEFRNRKDTADTVHFYERHWGEFKVSESSHAHTRPESQTLEFVVSLKPNEVKKVTFTIETLW
jgi:hypothetical protein